MAKFTGVSEELMKNRQFEEGAIKELVAMGVRKPMSGEEFQAAINRPRHKTVNPLKIARLLMPNGY